MKARTILLAAIAAAVVVTVLATGQRGAGTAGVPGAPSKAERSPEAKAPASQPAQSWSLSPRRADADAPAYPGAPASAGMPEILFTPATLPDRVATLARQVDSGSGGDPYELFTLLNECAATPHRLAMATGCGTAGDCGPSQQRLARYQETFAACNQVAPDLIGRRQQYLDLAASRGDPRAALVRQQPR